MRKRKIIQEVIIWTIVIIFFIVVLIIDKCIFESVTNSNLPDWVKWMLLH